MKRFASVIALFACTSMSAADLSVENTKSFKSDITGLTVISGELRLPDEGLWREVKPQQETGLRHVFLIPPAELLQKDSETISQRDAGVRNELQMDGEIAKNLFLACSDFARSHEGRGPDQWADIADSTTRYGFSMSTTSNFHLVPGAKFNASAAVKSGTAQKSPFEAPVPVIIELRPRVSDGMHWVVDSNGLRQRRQIDQALLDKLGAKLEARTTAPAGDNAGGKLYSVLALKTGTGSATLKLQLLNSKSGKTMDCTWNTAVPAAGDKSLMSAWAERRAWDIVTYAKASESPILLQWLSRFDDVYGAKIDPESLLSAPGDIRMGGGRDGEGSPDLFGVLGGRAAIRETLQMQALGDGRQPASQESARTIPLAQVKSLEVKSHPFTDMLKGETGGSLPLANFVPDDRAFIYFAKPASILPFLESGEGFLFDFGSAVTHNSISYDLKRRNLARLGISEDWLKLALNSGAIKEVAIELPDLFLIDGTDFTVVSRLTNPALFAPALSMVGLSGLSREIKSIKLKNGGQAYWALDKDLLVFSTNEKEADRVLTLSDRNGEGSLGRSAEFRYMLTQLPLKQESRAYVYISDQFIRRLVGPGVKIAQTRRLKARMALETISAGALLYKSDGHASDPDVATLAKMKYIPAAINTADFTIDGNLVASSRQYGTASAMKTVLDLPVDKVSQEEAQAYARYITDYSQFWRQFFDPIAIRLDDREGGGLALTTFILPLVDSSIYNGLRGVLTTKENRSGFKMPELSPAPVAMLSLNLAETSWQSAGGSFLGEFSRMLGVRADTFAKFGGGMHLAVCDSDPVLSVGSGELIGIPSSGLFARGGMGRGEMLFIPVALSLLSRPCHLLVELRDPAGVAAALRQARPPSAERWGPSISYYKLDGADKWVCVVDFMGVIKARLRLEVREGYLIISNIPWSPEPKLTIGRAELNGAMLKVNPASGTLQQPGLYTSAMESQRRTAMDGIGYLYPMIAAGITDVEKAGAMHASMFGFTPEHPAGGKWICTTNEPGSSIFGTVRNQSQPQFKEGTKDFGVFKGIETFSVNMQFEETGLRTLIEWKTKQE